VKPQSATETGASLTSAELADHTLHRRAVEAVVWCTPAVNFDVMHQAMVRDAKAGEGSNKIVYWSRLFDWKNQTLTPNPDSIYFMPFFNTKDVGPIVLEIPAADDGSITGSVDDCWQTAIEDVGPPESTKERRQVPHPATELQRQSSRSLHRFTVVYLRGLRPASLHSQKQQRGRHR
jgi:hypothetical protein